MDYARIIKEVGRGAHAARALDDAASEALYGALLDGEVPELEQGAILIAYRIKGESDGELAAFQRATQARVPLLRAPAGRRVLVLPSYNGARKQANLLPLFALLAERAGLPVLIHGTLDDFGRTTTASILATLGRLADATPAAAQASLDAGRVAFVAIDRWMPGLAALLATRRRLGVRTSAHTVAKLIEPCGPASLRLVSVTHPDYLERMRIHLSSASAGGLLMRGTEGEPVAPANRVPRIEWIHDGRIDVLLERAEEGAPGALPEAIDAVSTARWIEAVLAGIQLPPASLQKQLEVCLDVANAGL